MGFNLSPVFHKGFNFTERKSEAVMKGSQSKIGLGGSAHQREVISTTALTKQSDDSSPSLTAQLPRWHFSTNLGDKLMACLSNAFIFQVFTKNAKQTLFASECALLFYLKLVLILSKHRRRELQMFYHS